MISDIGNNFQFALSDVYALLHADQQTSNTEGDKLEVFLRAGVILMITAWETFIEDTIKAHFDKRIREAQDPKNVIRACANILTTLAAVIYRV